MSGRIRYYFQWVGRERLKLGCRIGETTYAQEFPRTTTLGDALDIVRQQTVRQATGLQDIFELDEEDNRE